MAAFEEMLGETLLKDSTNKVSTADALQGKTVCYYFSGHWCGPCRGFTPELVKCYEAMKAAGKNVEVVFVSSDQDQKGFDEYFKEMPWLALPYEQRDKKNALSKKYKVSGIPSLVVVDENGDTITTDARGEVGNDPEGKKFPWKPLSFAEALGDTFISPSGDEVNISELKGKVIGLYFSAHWCGPCRGFTPTLAERYNTYKEQGKNFEIIFVSSDRDEKSMTEYHKSMPWLAIPFETHDGRERKAALSKRFKVRGIPSLVILDEEGNTITENGRGKVENDPKGEHFPWHPAPVTDLNDEPDKLNDESCMVLLMEDESKDAQEKDLATMTALAEDMKKDKSNKVCFFKATSTGHVSTQIRKICSLDDKSKTLIMLDIPDSGAFYLSKDTDVTRESLQSFLDAYKSKSLERKQLN